LENRQLIGMAKLKNPFEKWKAKHHITLWGTLGVIWLMYSVATDENLANAISKIVGLN